MLARKLREEVVDKASYEWTWKFLRKDFFIFCFTRF
jgi:hypothetical protein